jgi:hypothetical protein
MAFLQNTIAQATVGGVQELKVGAHNVIVKERLAEGER